MQTWCEIEWLKIKKSMISRGFIFWPVSGLDA